MMASHRRLTTELNILKMHPDVQSYFHYENPSSDTKLDYYVIHGYLLPRTELYKHGAFKVRILRNSKFPWKSPVLDLLTYIYHPAISNSISQPRFCRCSHRMIWTIGTSIGQWLEQFVDIIEQPDTSYAYGRYCISNTEAQRLYFENREQYDRKARAMVIKYAHSRLHQPIASLKMLAKQKIRRQLNLQSVKIDQLPLPEHLKIYLNSFSHGFKHFLKS